jgi:hypothetical protein
LTVEALDRLFSGKALERLFAGMVPNKRTLDEAPMLNWWHVTRLSGGDLFLFGVFGARRPGLGSTLQGVGPVLWMAHDMTWCRCEDGWYRLGYAEIDTPGETK